jgi:hypothetical protein
VEAFSNVFQKNYVTHKNFKGNETILQTEWDTSSNGITHFFKRNVTILQTEWHTSLNGMTQFFKWNDTLLKTEWHTSSNGMRHFFKRNDSSSNGITHFLKRNDAFLQTEWHTSSKALTFLCLIWTISVPLNDATTGLSVALLYVAGVLPVTIAARSNSRKFWDSL